MAITFDHASPSGDSLAEQAIDANVTFSFTINAGSDIILLVFIQGSVSGITYAGNALTQIASRAVPNTGAIKSQMWRLLNPPVGTANVVCTSDGTTGLLMAGAAQYNGVGSIDASNTNAGTPPGSPTTMSVAVTTIAENCWVVATLTSQEDSSSGHTWTQTAGTSRSNLRRNNSNAWRIEWCDNNAAKTPPGSVTLSGSMTSDGNINWAAVGASIAPAPPPPPFVAVAQFIG